MLRIALSSKRRLASSSLSFMATRSTQTHLVAASDVQSQNSSYYRHDGYSHSSRLSMRSFSTMDDKEQQQEEGERKDEGEEGDIDRLELFFKKRRAALQSIQDVQSRRPHKPLNGNNSNHVSASRPQQQQNSGPQNSNNTRRPWKNQSRRSTDDLWAIPDSSNSNASARQRFESNTNSTRGPQRDIWDNRRPGNEFNRQQKGNNNSRLAQTDIWANPQTNQEPGPGRKQWNKNRNNDQKPADIWSTFRTKHGNNNNNNNDRQGQTKPSEQDNTKRRLEFEKANLQAQQQQRKQQQNNMQQQQQQQHGTRDSSRISQMLKELRRNPPTPKPSSRTPTPQMRQSWRQRFQQPSSSSDDSASLDENIQRWTRSILRNNQRGNQRRQQKQQQHRADSDFLMGQLISPKKEDETPADNTATQQERRVILPNYDLSLTEASTLLRVKMEDIQDNMRKLGSTTLDVDTMELLAMEFGIETEREEMEEFVDGEEALIKQRRVVDDDELESSLPPRPPVVCIMGHVDHGKTTLMDALRRRAIGAKTKKTKKAAKKKGKKGAAGSGSSDVAGTEAGGITQIISAFEVALEGQDGKVTFLDTPGHAAFKSMRLSGTHAADVIVLVVAADDGVSAQTIEILDFYKSIVKGSDGGITMVVALNKIDKPGIDVDEAQMRVENQLLEQGIVCEGMNMTESEFGPPVQVIPTSGLTGQGLDDLMDGLILQSEVMDLRADDQAHAEGIVMDARMEKGLGAVVDCIIRWGSIEKDDIVVSGTQVARVRMLKDVNNKMMKQGLPSQPVRLIGFKSLPKAGDPIVCVESEEIGEEIVEQRELLEEAENDRPDAPVGDVEVHIHGSRSRDNSRSKRVMAKANLEKGDGTIRIPVIVKADADGSLSAVRDSLVGLGEESSHNVVIDPVLEGIGEVTASDIQMAKESDAVIFVFGFKRVDQATLNLAEQLGVTIECNEIIYSLLDEAKVVFGTYLPATPTEHVHGRGMVQAIFEVDTDKGEDKIAGMRVTEGNLYKEKGLIDTKEIKTYFRVLRDGARISPEGEVVSASSLRHYKELVDSVRHGDECGLALSGFSDFEEGDIIECYSIDMKHGTL